MTVRKSLWRWSSWILAIVLGTGAAGYGQAGSETKGSDTKSAVKATVEGELVALDSSPKGLKVTKAVAEDGREVAMLKGQVLRLLPGGKGKDLLQANAVGANVSVRGKLNLAAKEIQVDSFKSIPKGSDTK